MDSKLGGGTFCQWLVPNQCSLVSNLQVVSYQLQYFLLATTCFLPFTIFKILFTCCYNPGQLLDETKVKVPNICCQIPKTLRITYNWRETEFLC